MITYLDSHKVVFPSVETATHEGVLAVGGNLEPQTLIDAYCRGIFPWFNPEDPILWWAPPKRMVLFFEDLKISKSMRNVLNQEKYTVTFNTCFEQVIRSCQKIQRPGQEGTWITDHIVASYCQLHCQGRAISVEVWHENRLVGGLYGIDMGTVFCGESMFSFMPNASKVAFITLSRYLQENGYKLLDCQVYNNHLASLGAKEISRELFMSFL